MIKKGINEVKNIFGRFIRLDFSGTAGTAAKNSGYQLSTTLIAKIGSLAFTAIVARMLHPELFGLYTLTIGTVIFISAIADLGLDSAMLTFTSKYSIKNNKKAKEYFDYISSLKIKFTLFASLIVLITSYWISNYYYQKPIFWALIIGSTYLFLSSMSRYVESIYLSVSNFKVPLVKEILFQIFRFTVIPISLLFLINSNLSNKHLVLALVFLMSTSYLASLLYLWIQAKKSIKFLTERSKNLNSDERKRVRKFIFPLTATVLSGVFFGYVDTIMLGRYVSEEYIGYYGAAFSLASSAIMILGFMAIALFPIFSKEKKEKLSRILGRVLIISLIIAIMGSIFTFVFAKYIILLAYGNSFLPATTYLKFLSILLITGTLTSIYHSYFVSQEKTRSLAGLLIATTLLNIALNYLLITSGLEINMNNAVIGACIATIISRFFYLFGLALFTKKKY